MSVNTLLVRSYASNVYLAGTNSFAKIEATRSEYVPHVKQYAANAFYIEDIDYSLAKAFITPIEHAETLALKGPDDPQHRPPFSMKIEQDI